MVIILLSRYPIHCQSYLFIIDFDWSGKIGEQWYPFFMNHEEIRWPEGAKDNELITSDHDLYWIEQAFP